MVDNAIALRVEGPDFGNSFSRGAAQAQDRTMNSMKMNMMQKEQGREEALQLMNLMGSIGLGAMGGNIEGEADPQKWEQGLDYLDSLGIGLETSKYRNKPQMARMLVDASVSAADRLKMARDDREFALSLAEFDQKLNSAADAGLTPIYGRDAEDNIVVMQPTKSGKVVRSEMPEGVTVDLGVKTQESEKGKARGKAQGEAEVELATTLQKADQAIALIDQILTHPGRATGTGLSATLDPRNYVAGTDATDFNVMRKQLEGKAFLEAFESLKGGGQITEVEGQKATEAIARLSTAQSDEAFVQALNELKGIIASGKDRARAKAGRGVDVAPVAASRQTIDGVDYEQDANGDWYQVE